MLNSVIHTWEGCIKKDRPFVVLAVLGLVLDFGFGHRNREEEDFAGVH